MTGGMMFSGNDLGAIARAPTEEKMRKQQEGLMDLSDEELETLYRDGKLKWKKGEGDSMWYPPEQTDEVYGGMAAGRVLMERHGEDYILHLL